MVDAFSRGTLDNIKHCIHKLELIKGDLSKREVAQEAIDGMDVCFHLAAVIGGVGYITEHPAEICKNIPINYNVIEACRKMDVDRLLYTSTACAYPVYL